MSAVRENLMAAKALIDHPNKWLKGSCTNGRGRYCMLGAINKVIDPGHDPFGSGVNWTRDDRREIPEYAALIAVADEILPTLDDGTWVTWNDTFDITQVNDHDKTRHRQVMEIYDKAIERA